MERKERQKILKVFESMMKSLKNIFFLQLIDMKEGLSEQI